MKFLPIAAAALFAATAAAQAETSSAPSGAIATPDGLVMIPAAPVNVDSGAGGSQISSLLWVYNAQLKRMMLCASRTDGNFSCTPSAPLGWQAPQQ